MMGEDPNRATFRLWLKLPFHGRHPGFGGRLRCGSVGGLAGNRRRMFAEGLADAAGRDHRVNDATLKLVPHWRHAAELLHDPNEGLDRVVHVFGRVVLAQGEDQVALREGVVQADGGKDMRNLQ